MKKGDSVKQFKGIVKVISQEIQIIEKLQFLKLFFGKFCYHMEYSEAKSDGIVWCEAKYIVASTATCQGMQIV